MFYKSCLSSNFNNMVDDMRSYHHLHPFGLLTRGADTATRVISIMMNRVHHSPLNAYRVRPYNCRSEY